MSLNGRNEKVKIFLGLGTKGSRMKMLDVGWKVGGDGLKACIERVNTMCQPLDILLEHAALHP